MAELLLSGEPEPSARVTAATHPADTPRPNLVAHDTPARVEQLRYVKIGHTVRFCRSIDELDERPPAVLWARCFLDWVADRFPHSVKEWITAGDIEEHLHPMFMAEGGGPRSFLSLARGLGKVTEKRSSEYIDRDGVRRTRTEYFVPEPQGTVVELAEEKRKRA